MEEEAADLVKPGDRVVFTMGREPLVLGLLAALTASGPRRIIGGAERKRRAGLSRVFIWKILRKIFSKGQPRT